MTLPLQVEMVRLNTEEVVLPNSLFESLMLRTFVREPAANEILVELVDHHHPLYDQVNDTASAVYQEVLGFNTLSRPPRFVTLYWGEEVMGSGGIYFGSDRSQLVVEQFSHNNTAGVTAYLQEHNVNPKDPAHRERFAEVTCFNVVEAYRKEYVKPLLGFIFLYLYLCGVPATLNILAGTLVRPLLQLGAKPIFFCNADITHYDGTAEQKRSIQERYINRLRPRCVGIDSRDVARCFLENHQPYYNHIGIGPCFSALLQDVLS